LDKQATLRPAQARPEAPAAGARTAGPRNVHLKSLSATLNGRAESQVEAPAPVPERAPLQLRPNRTGLPDHLKAGVEALSGRSLDHVRVNRNSGRPAQLSARAFAQGGDIHLAPGQERHLAHEAWHVVQQAEGSVSPTMRAHAGLAVNDDPGLEHEADVMGARALSLGARAQAPPTEPVPGGRSPSGQVAQRYIHAESLEENGSEPVGVILKWDYTVGRWLSADGQHWTGQQPLFSPGVKSPPTTKPDRKEALKQRRREILARNTAAALERRNAQLENADQAAVPQGAEPVTVDPYALEQAITQRAANLAKTQPLGIKVVIVASRRRATDLAFLDEATTNQLIDCKSWFKAEGAIWADVTGAQRFLAKLETDNPEKVERALCIRMLILNEEAQPRSGAGRAASDEVEGSQRAAARDEAAYHGPVGGLHHKPPEDTPLFKAVKTSDRLSACIAHTGPWTKGVRDPDQSAVMGGQNAKNYVVDSLHPNLDFFGKWGKKNELAGRWEWLHLIGSSLGGPNTANNLVAGSYDANTKMIALEHRVANWGSINYRGDFRPTPDTPVQIETLATVNPTKTQVGDRIEMKVTHGGKTVVTGDYAAASLQVITKSQYATEETRVGTEIDRARPSQEKEDL
jgi:hypothetical protein